MKKSDFYYDLSEELIAQTPPVERDGSSMIVLPKRSGEPIYTEFKELSKYLKSGDCLVFNDSKVIPARLLGRRKNGNPAELLLLKPVGNGMWEALARPGRRLKPGESIVFGDGLLWANVEKDTQDGTKLIKFSYSGIFEEILDRLGKTPLPPYIKTELEDSARYQTIYSKMPGSAAAPTAGLHFTPGTLEKLDDMGVDKAFLTLHVGLGTFRPVKTEEITDHKMHSEAFWLNKDCADKINNARARGGRIIAVGTTSCRVLEAVAKQHGDIRPCSGETDIFIYPGYEFLTTDGLLTNFHLPESTLLMLISALAGRERVLCAYREAVQRRYRFFSFGDCMLIL